MNDFGGGFGGGSGGGGFDWNGNGSRDTFVLFIPAGFMQLDW